MSTKPILAKLEAVEIRTIWRDEARNFTPWLTTDEGLELLGEVLGVPLELVKSEAEVGPFSADLLLRVPGDAEHTIVVENQFGKTDHDHLGKLLTYGAGLGARTVVWIAETFCDEHRQTLDWLNEQAGESASYFGLELRLFSIANSPPAAQFNIVSSPNAWANVVRATKYEYSEREAAYQQFWRELAEYLAAKKSPLRMQKPQPQSWSAFSLGRSGFIVTCSVNNRRGKGLCCELYIDHEKSAAALEQLQAQKATIEQELGEPLSWQRLRKNCRVAVYKEASFDDPTQREAIKTWFHRKADAFQRIFARRVKELQL